jgi:hypothetical protein
VADQPSRPAEITRSAAASGSKLRSAEIFLLVSVALTVLLWVVPHGRTIGYPLLLISTLVHELGHGVAGVLVGGDFDRFEMFANGSGVAHVVGYDGRIARAVVSAGGLVGPAFAAALGFALARGPRRARGMLVGLGAALLLADVLVVRNLFCWFFVTSFAAILLVVALRAKPWASQLVLLFLSVQLSLSVFSRGDYLFTDRARTGAGDFPSDVAHMADALFLPYWFWGALCGAISVVVLALGVFTFLRGERKKTLGAGQDPSSRLVLRGSKA